MTQRLESHFDLATRLSLVSDTRLTTILSRAKLNKGWGQNGEIELDGRKLFVKMIPLTDIEYNNAYSTKNLFRMPTWYSYGVGSAGFGAFRELAANVKATNWVLNSECSAFPLLHHHRILAIPSRSGASDAEINQYVSGWNNSRTIARYIRERAHCQHHLVLFLEHLTPFTDWIIGREAKLDKMFRKALSAAQFLRGKRMIHFDGHIQNWLTDGQQIFLCDFGLALDKEFELTTDEQHFFKVHRHYDLAQVISTTADGVLLSYFSLSPDDQTKVNDQLGESPSNFSRFLFLLTRDSLELHAANLIRLPAALRRFVTDYKPIIDLKHEFFDQIRFSKKSSDLYPAQKLKRLLKKAAVDV